MPKGSGFVLQHLLSPIAPSEKRRRIAQNSGHHALPCIPLSENHIPRRASENPIPLA
jgi:hypothetical protein